jgi:hypothetical protein
MQRAVEAAAPSRKRLREFCAFGDCRRVAAEAEFDGDIQLLSQPVRQLLKRAQTTHERPHVCVRSALCIQLRCQGYKLQSCIINEGNKT